jgi:hypothetical protein
MIFLTIIAIPFIIALFAFIISKIFDTEDFKITLPEFLIQLGIVLLLGGISVGIVSCQNLYYTEVWNGHVTKKTREEVHCRHSYKCHCYTTCSGSGSNRSCTEHCSTCYDHAYDVDWTIYDNTGHTWDIDTTDRQGLNKPVFWEQAQKDDPTSHLHEYKNYIKAAPGSLFNKQGLVEKYSKVLPVYPMSIYKYYNLDRIVTIGYKLDNKKYWNRELSFINSLVGKAKQCNAILVLVKNQPREYLYALEQHWLGGNKNDAILVISLGNEGEIQWADVIALVQNSIFKINLRNDIQDMKFFEPAIILGTFHKNIEKHYKRKRMRTFQYLEASITPTPTQYAVVIILCSLCSIGLSVFFYFNDIKEMRDNF